MVRTLLSTIASLGLLAIPVLIAKDVAAAPAFTLEDYFEGRSVAKGIFVSKIAGSRREFDVFLTGKWDGKTLTLREDFVFSDGEKDRKTWVFTKTGEGTYIGTREDVIGSTVVTINDNVALFEYDVLIPRKGKKPVKVHFDDKMVLKEDGTIENRARVSKFFFPVGKVAVDFLQGDDISKLSVPTL